VPVTVTPVALVATTVKVEELPVVIEVGFATMLTVGAAGWVTVTVTLAEVLPPGPVAVAVYVVVTVGLTGCTPPFAVRV
jgi:hypothetical protein